MSRAADGALPAPGLMAEPARRRIQVELDDQDDLVPEVQQEVEAVKTDLVFK